MSVYGTFKKGCPECGGGPASGAGTGIRPGSDPEEPCAKCNGTGILESRTSRAAIQLAREKRGERG